MINHKWTTSPFSGTYSDGSSVSPENDDMFPRLEEITLDSKQYAGLNFQDCLERIMFNTDHLRN